MAHKKPVPPANMWDVLDQEINSMDPPEGTFTTVDIAERKCVTYSCATGYVDRLLRLHKAEFVGVFKSKSGRICKYYRLK